VQFEIHRFDAALALRNCSVGYRFHGETTEKTRTAPNSRKAAAPRVTPAMEAGITDHVWTVEDLIIELLGAGQAAA